MYKTDAREEGMSYPASVVANSNQRVRKAFPDKILLMYGPAAGALICNTEAKVGSINYMMHNGVNAPVDNSLAGSLGFSVEEVRKRFIGMHDRINSISIEIGMTHERFAVVATALEDAAGGSYSIGAHTFAGIPVIDLLSHSVLLRHANAVVPSPAHQLSLLYITWLADSRGDPADPSAAPLLEHFKSQYGSLDALRRVPYYFFGIDSKEYAKAMLEDIGRMLRKQGSS